MNGTYTLLSSKYGHQSCRFNGAFAGKGIQEALRSSTLLPVDFLTLHHYSHSQTLTRED